MQLPTIQICNACSQHRYCSTLNCNINFIDWEKYKKIYHPSSQTKRCDIIYNKINKICFIELKAKDWFSTTKKLKKHSSDIYTEIYNELYGKITNTYDEYNLYISSTQTKKNIFSIIFSKQMSFHWTEKELPTPLIKELLRTRIFPKFPQFQNNQFLHLKKYPIILDTRECTTIHVLLNS